MSVVAEVRMERAQFAGHDVSYCVLGDGPTLVLVKPHRGTRVYGFAERLAPRFKVLQIEPLGHGWSDRPQDHPPGGVHEQVHTVLDREGLDRFIVWGYSAGGAMALAVAQASPRVTALVCGGWSPAERLSDASLRRMDREQRAPAGHRAFWHWHSRFDWLTELSVMETPTLVYVGSKDGPRVRGPRGIPRVRATLEELGVEVAEFEGLDHVTCMTEPAFSTRVQPLVLDWMARTGVC